MRIAFIVTEFPTLSETFILNQIIGLLDMGHDVEIFADYNPKEKKVHTDVEKYRLMERVHFFNIPKNKIIRLLKAIYLLITNFYKAPLTFFKCRKIGTLYMLICFSDKSFDVIHCHYGPNGILGIHLKAIGVTDKIITTFHAFDVSTVVSMHGYDVYKDLFLKGNLFLPISNYCKKKLLKLGCDEKKIAVHHMGISLDKFKPLERKIQLEKPVTLLTIGRLFEKKGHEYTIKAVAQLVNKYKNINHVIAGDGPLRHKLEKLVLKLGIKNHIKFLGSVDQNEVLELYRQAHIFILPSITAGNGDQEGIPLVLMEAQAAGLPVISTYHSGIPEVVVDGKSGFLVPEKDIEALAEKITYLIEHPEIWPEMGRSGRKFVEENYDIQKLNKQLVEIYNTVIDR